MADLLPEVGATVRHLSDRDKTVGTGSKPTRWLVGGALGVVGHYINGYAEHACPDHSRAPECVCGDEDDGRVEAQLTAAVILWETVPPGDPLKRCIDMDGENTEWERTNV